MDLPDPRRGGTENGGSLKGLSCRDVVDEGDHPVGAAKHLCRAKKKH
jgi:hypothetical protein